MVFHGIDEGPTAAAVVYDCGSRRGLRCAGGTAIILAVLQISSTGNFVADQWPVAAFLGLVIVSCLLLETRIFGCRHRGIAIDGRGIWWRDEAHATLVLLPWMRIRSLDTKWDLEGVSSRVSHILVDLRGGADAAAGCPGLAEARGTGKLRGMPARPHVRLPSPRRGDSFSREVRRFAPDVRWRLLRPN